MFTPFLFFPVFLLALWLSLLFEYQPKTLDSVGKGLERVGLIL